MLTVGADRARFRDWAPEGGSVVYGGLDLRMLAMEPLQLDSEIPASHPEKQAIEEAIRKALAGLSGWKVQIAVAKRAAWWVIRIQGPHFRRALVVEGPEKQNAPDISSLVTKAMGGWTRGVS